MLPESILVEKVFSLRQVIVVSSRFVSRALPEA